ncbi:polyphosphate polymerase domain-containing protein [Actinomadura madurae]|uniref:polyphosphate polymerase domain-containing protein n=1 Tax=Actinomadura madurae TaxID=1993 RepID=UPI002025FA60|nr:polyphosphate polymerase domain-containing protein [Actinomadura madurae]MCP9955237.1 polyphosphate polymerase domain-containing protein [Actinomadura madurae]MCP9971973.1 polyphosphate polymerase domain-containing protein [Actinomadura madurae]MCP9984474.1 polyphosphate polymerase domain-containing protein [Actinomadura madurae]MCQ0003971.1 polyphosphate polymerase domain-containing protein [Actinomadura madurae]URN00709.1 polyphosphate polymerase domain-containing protein [Actinomadura ma
MTDTAALIGGAAARLPAIGLDGVLARSALQLRMDRKYILPARLAPELLDRIAETHAVLEIGGLRTFRYTSTYFDTPGLLTYRQHVQDRRRRFKIRTRTYLDSDECMFEVKVNGARDATDKRRMPYDPACRTRITPPAEDFLWETLLAAYRMNPPAPLVSSATTSYRRVTLAQRRGTGRVTLDFGLVCTRPGARAWGRDDWLLVESKSAAVDAPADRLLRRMGARPVRISKYCLAVAVLYPGAVANPWHRVLRRCFDPADAVFDPAGHALDPAGPACGRGAGRSPAGVTPGR